MANAESYPLHDQQEYTDRPENELYDRLAQLDVFNNQDPAGLTEEGVDESRRIVDELYRRVNGRSGLDYFQATTYIGGRRAIARAYVQAQQSLDEKYLDGRIAIEALASEPLVVPPPESEPDSEPEPTPEPESAPTPEPEPEPASAPPAEPARKPSPYPRSAEKAPEEAPQDDNREDSEEPKRVLYAPTSIQPHKPKHAAPEAEGVGAGAAPIAVASLARVYAPGKLPDANKNQSAEQSSATPVPAPEQKHQKGVRSWLQRMGLAGAAAGAGKAKSEDKPEGQPRQDEKRRTMLAIAAGGLAVAVATMAAVAASKGWISFSNPERDAADSLANRPSVSSEVGAPPNTTLPGVTIRPPVAAETQLAAPSHQSTVSNVTLNHLTAVGLYLPPNHAQEVINEVSQRVVQYNGLEGRERSLPVGQTVQFPSRDVMEQWLATATANAQN